MLEMDKKPRPSNTQPANWRMILESEKLLKLSIKLNQVL